MQPRLRLKTKDGSDFPEWEIKTISNSNLYISDGNYGEQYPTSSQMVTSGVPFIRANNIKELKLVWDDMKYITPEHHHILTSGHLKYKDILITTRGEIGSIAFVSQEFDGANINAQICLLRVKDNNQITPEFLLQALSTNQSKKQFKELQTGSALKQLPKSNLGKVKIPVPLKEEQTKIASFLSAIDEKVNQITRKHELLNQYKKGLMQKIFNQEIRFTDPFGNVFSKWETSKLSEVALVVMGQSPGSASYNLIGDGSCLIQGNADIKDRKTLPRLWTTNVTKECFIDDIILTVRAPVGAVAISKHHGCIGRGVCAIRPNKKIVSGYLYQLLVWYEGFKWKSLEQGSTFTAVGGTEVNSLEVPIPSLEEQTKISNFFSAIDGKIANLKRQQELTKQYKQGLLQQMFV
jgi:type I restriction enzyme S subunit